MVGGGWQDDGEDVRSYLAETDLQESGGDSEGPQTGGEAGYAGQSDGVSRSPAGQQTVGPRCLHGEEGHLAPVVGVEPLQQPQGETSPPTLVTRQAGLSVSWLVSSPTRLACPAQVEGWLKG